MSRACSSSARAVPLSPRSSAIGIGPIAHRTINVEQVADDVRILRMEPEDLTIIGDCLLPVTLPPLNGGDIPGHRAVVRQKRFRDAKLSQRVFVVAVKPIIA